MTALQKIIKGAKSLQKKNKNLSWKDAVKKSSIIYNAGKKTTAKKTVKKKTVSKKIAAVKKVPVKKSLSHKDTKSHNVNIRVMSGSDNYSTNALKLIKEHNFEIDNLRKSILQYEKAIKENKKADLSVKNNWRKSVKVRKEIISVHKKGINQLKKYL